MARLPAVISILAASLALGGGPAAAEPEVADAAVGLVDPATGRWYLRTATGTTSFVYGDPGDTPVLGDWDCDGSETPGLYRRRDGFVYLRNANTQGNADVRFFFGDPGDVPLAGDFDGDGCDTISIYRPAQARVYVINELGADDGGLGAADFDYVFGDKGDKPFVGDFDGDGVDTIGLHRESTGFVYFRQSHTQGNADAEFFFGNPGDRLVAADWNGDGIDTPGVFRPSEGRFYLRYSNTQGNADEAFDYGSAPLLPVGGAPGVLPGGDPAPPRGPQACIRPGGSQSTRRFAVAPGSGPVSGPGPLRTFTVQVEDGLPVDVACFAASVEAVLGDERSWGAGGRYGFQRVRSAADFTVMLATPATTDWLCHPIRTGGIFSCRNGSRAIINFWRWENGAAAYGSDLTGYRTYVLNHEVGHYLGKRHRGCPGSGRPAPVMMQQTKGVGSCVAQPWPTAAELG